MTIYRFQEHNLVIQGEEADLVYIAELLRNAEGTAGDLRYQIEIAFNIGNVCTDLGIDAEDQKDNHALCHLLCDNVRLKKQESAEQLAKLIATNWYRCPVPEEIDVPECTFWKTYPEECAKCILKHASEIKLKEE